jgi:hypothetical protein
MPATATAPPASSGVASASGAARDPLASGGLRDPLAGGGASEERSSLTRGSVEKASISLEGPAFGVPGLKWAVSVEGEREVEKETLGGKPETSVSLAVSGGLKYELWFLELGVDLTADLDVKVDGDVSTQEALQQGVSEFARWYAASRLGEVAEKRAMLETAFSSTRGDLLAAYRELGQLLNGGTFKDFQDGATTWFYLSQSPRMKAEGALNAFQNTISMLFSAAKATGDQRAAALLFVDKDGMLADFASAASTSQDKAQSNIDRSRNKLLSKFDPSKAKLMDAFDGLDTAKVLARNKDVEFSGTFGGNLGSTMSWGGSGGDDNGVELSAGAGRKIQSGDGDQFELDSETVLRGTLGVKLGDWEVEASGERGAGDPDEAGWTLGLEATRTGSLVEGGEEEVVAEAAASFSGLQSSGLSPNTTAVPAALEQLLEAVVDPADVADGLMPEGGAEGTIGVAGELEYTTKRDDSTAPWKFSDFKGEASVSMMGGVKAELDLGAASALGKAEGSIEKGFKVKKGFG